MYVYMYASHRFVWSVGLWNAVMALGFGLDWMSGDVRRRGIYRWVEAGGCYKGIRLGWGGKAMYVWTTAMDRERVGDS